MASGPNIAKLIADHAPEAIAEKEGELREAVANVLRLQQELAELRTYAAVARPAPEPEEKRK